MNKCLMGVNRVYLRFEGSAVKGESIRQVMHLYSSPRWRVRAAKGARLESACGGNLTVGSNPTATATNFRGFGRKQRKLLTAPTATPTFTFTFFECGLTLTR